MSETRIGILGAGPAGLGAAWWLAERGFEVDVFERQDRVGGNAGSFEVAGLRVDYGSHRLHPAADPVVFERLRQLLGSDLLERPRHGRIGLLGRWIHFPLRPLDLALRLPPRFAMGAAWDQLRGLLPRGRRDAPETFASILERGLGRTICREFYFPYARKIWGLEPDEIAAEQARRRVSAGSVGKLLARLVPGAGKVGAATRKGTFFYPRRGFGQISEAIADAASRDGARIRLESAVERVHALPDGGFEIESKGPEGAERTRVDHVWSTVPVTLLARLLDPAPPPVVLEAAGALELRAMLLVYLVLEQDRFTEYDAHYFPGPEVPFTRLSEPKNYAAVEEPRGRTVLCAELPCDAQDPIFGMDERALGQLVVDGLERAGLPLRVPVAEVVVRRLPAAYPRYRRGYAEPFARLDAWLETVPDLLSFGRQGLFAHDNTHHALFMAWAASDCLRGDGRFDREEWARYRRLFETHVVED